MGLRILERTSHFSKMRQASLEADVLRAFGGVSSQLTSLSLSDFNAIRASIGSDKLAEGVCLAVEGKIRLDEAVALAVHQPLDYERVLELL